MKNLFQSLALGLGILCLCPGCTALPMGTSHGYWLTLNAAAGMHEILKTIGMLIHKAHRTPEQRPSDAAQHYKQNLAQEDENYSNRFWQQARMSDAEVREDLEFLRDRIRVIFATFGWTPSDFPKTLTLIQNAIGSLPPSPMH